MAFLKHQAFHSVGITDAAVYLIHPEELLSALEWHWVPRLYDRTSL